MRMLLGAVFLLPGVAFADEATFDVFSCEGARLVANPAPMTLSEINVLVPNLNPPQPGQGALMRFELPSGGRSWGFTEETSERLAGHCETQHHMRVKPLDGSWSVDVLNVDMRACPEGVQPPTLPGTIRELDWPAFFTPAPFFAGTPVDFDYEMIDRLHWLAKATPALMENAQVEVTYDFQAVSRTRIDIQGNMNFQMDAGTQQVDCTANVTMVASHLGE